MSITFLSHPIHLPDFSMFDREYLGKQESQNEDQKVFHKDTLEVSQLSKNRENLMDKIKHTVVHSVIVQRYESRNIKGNQGRKRAVWLFGCCECLWAELCKAVF